MDELMNKLQFSRARVGGLHALLPMAKYDDTRFASSLSAN